MSLSHSVLASSRCVSPVAGWLRRGAVLLAIGLISVAALADPNPEFTVGVNNAPGQKTTLKPGEQTVVRFTLQNDSATPFNGVHFDVSPTGGGTNTLVVVGSPPFPITGTGCTGGAVDVSAGAGNVKLTGLTVPAKAGGTPGVCYVDVPVMAISSAGASSTVTYALDEGAVGTAGSDTNKTGGSQGFAVLEAARPTWTKAFSPSTAVLGGAPATLTLKITNPADGVALSGIHFEDVFPTAGGKAVIEPEGTPATLAGCGPSAAAALTTGDNAKVSVTDASLASGQTCTVTMQVKARQTNGEYQLANQQNRLDPAGFGSDQGLKPGTTATANITVRSPLSVTKSATPARVASGQNGTFVVTLTNSGTVALPVTQFNELNIDGGGQSGQRLTPTGISNSCGGTNTYTASAGGGFQTGGYSIPAGSSCTIAVTFTGTTDNNTPLTFTNSIPKAAIDVGDAAIVSQDASAAVTIIDELFVDKSRSPANAAPGSAVRYTVTISNFGTTDRTDVHLTDALKNGSTFLTGTIGGADYTPTLTPACGVLGNVPAKGATAVDFIIPTLAAASGNTPGQCVVSFWVMTSPDATTNTANRIDQCGVWYGSQAAPNCNGRPSNEVTTTYQKALVADKTFNGTNYQYPGGMPNGTDQTGLSKPEGTPVTMRIRVRNYSDAPLTTVTLGDTFPSGLKIAAVPNASSTCGGTVTAAAGTTSIALNGAEIPARTASTNAPGLCTVQVDVVGPAGTYPNTAQVTATQTYADGEVATVEANTNQATLTYTGALETAKVFIPGAMTADGKAQVRIRLTNTDPVNALTDVSVTDPLPAAPNGLVLANPAGMYTTCGGSPVVTGAAGGNQARLTGAALPPGGSCDFLFDVVNTGSGTGNWVNTIPIGGVTAANDVHNTTPVTATLLRSSEAVPTLSKSISPTTVAPGEAARLTILITNGNQAVTGLAVTDYFTTDGTASGTPNGMRIANPANVATTCTGAVPAAIVGSAQLALTGGQLAASASCTLSVDVTSTNPGAVVNTIPLKAITTDQGHTNSTTMGSATLQTNKSMTLDKHFIPNVASAGERVRLRINFHNSTMVAATNFALTDNLPAGMVVPPGPNVVQTCGPNTVVDVSDATKVMISRGTLAAAVGGSTTSCYVELDVQASAEGDYVNTIPNRGFTVDGDPVDHPPSSDTLHVLKPLVLHKAIDSRTLDAGSPAGFTTGAATRAQGQPATLTLRLTNPNTSAVSELVVIDNLPTGLVVALTPDTATTCSNGTVTAAPSATSVRLTGATLAAGASCDVTVQVLSNTPGNYVNTVPAGAVTTKEGVTNGSVTNAELVVSGVPTVAKQFTPAVIPANGTSRLTIVLGNPNTTELTLTAALVDTLPTAPGTMKVATPPAVGGTCPGTVTAAAGALSVTYASGAKIPAGGCTIEVNVTADLAGTYNNTIPSGALQTDGGHNADAANAPLKVSTQGYISGKVYADNNVTPDGVFNGTDQPIAGVPVELHAGNSCTGALLATATTDALGNYLFSDLAAGSYSVCQGSQPPGTSNGTTTAGTIQSVNGSTGTPGSASNPSATTSAIAGIVLGATGTGEVSGSVDNNFAEIKPSSISGKVYKDLNNDGLINGADSGIGGQTVQLLDGMGNVVQTTVTDADGNYRFDNLLPGTYSVRQPAQPDGTSNGKAAGGSVPNGGTAGVGSNPSATSSQIAGIVLPPNTHATGNNFGEIPGNRTISGSVFLDVNNDGLMNGTDHGIGGVPITLTGTDVNGNTITRSTTTQPDGSYSFTDLPEGTYTIVQPGQPDGTTNAPPHAGTTGGTPSNPTATSSQIASINLTGANTVSANNNFPEQPGPHPDLKIVKTSLTNTLAAGSSVPGVFTLTPSNIGTVPTSGTITVTDPLPAGMTLAAPATGAGWSCPAPAGATSVTCTSDAVIAAGATGAPITIKVLASVSASGELLTNIARISGGGEPDGFVGPENESAAQVQASAPAKVSGTVWRDVNHDRVLDPGEPRVSGVRVELKRDGVVVASAVTDEQGRYTIDGVPPGTGYELRFIDAAGVVYLGGVTNETGAVATPGHRDLNDPNPGTNAGNPAGATIVDGTLEGMTLLAGDNIVEQSLPLDPSGVIYDAVTRQPVAGAVVTITGPAGFDPTVHLAGSQGTQTTGADGYYQFWLSPSAPAGTYTLQVTAPAGYVPGPSTMLPACAPPTLDVSAGLHNPEVIQQSAGAPGTGVPAQDPAACTGATAPNTTQYYFSFTINPAVSHHVVNNHIPLDPVSGGAIVMTKTSPKVNVTKGELVPYTITATNTLAVTLTNVNVQDQIPPGFRYRIGSATYNGLPLEPAVSARLLQWPSQTFAPAEKKTFQMLLMVGAGVGEGEYVNQTWSINDTVKERISNVATATVRVVPDPLFDCSDLIGTVFDDKNANGYQDQGELGIPNVRVVTVRGLLVTSDAQGRFHVACADIPQADHGSNFVMKLDERTLPSGYRLTTENPRDVRVTRGKMVKLNFGATVHKVLRLEVDQRAFTPDTDELAPVWAARLAPLALQLAERPSVLRIAYRMGTNAEKKVAERRLEALAQHLRSVYAEQARQASREHDTPRLVIETESFATQHAEGGAQ
ncbi:MAG: hypothetical protein OZ923_12150 [Comamonadaceae bacterium]|nr:DUF11 domain-containing protein [Burkholderiales bacterium]MEB2349348.1 hypothetical protein [Comamonadaceae bacterium]